MAGKKLMPEVRRGAKMTISLCPGADLWLREQAAKESRKPAEMVRVLVERARVQEMTETPVPAPEPGSRRVTLMVDGQPASAPAVMPAADVAGYLSDNLDVFDGGSDAVTEWRIEEEVQ